MDKTHKHLSLEPPTDRLGEPDDGVRRLYHYTTMSGLLGIVESKKLRATDIHYMNDANEFKHGLAILGEIVKVRAQTAAGTTKLFLETLPTRVAQFSNINLFAASFTEDGDLLSQWRGYSQGGGASIGFDTAQLKYLASLAGFDLIKCIYNDELKREIAGEFLDRKLGHLGKEAGIDTRGAYFAANGLLWEYYQLAACFKDSAFSEENEWRLVSKIAANTNGAISFRATSSMLIPYLEIPLSQEGQVQPSLGFDRITIGPSSHKELIENAFVMLCERGGILPKHIGKSQSPYRLL
jgi:hypothetical protein